MRHILVLSVCLLVLAPHLLFARVGESLDDCIKRYGKATAIPMVYDFGEPVKELAYFDFEKHGIAIQIGFLNGKACDLSFRHAPAADPAAPAPPALSQVEIDTLLAANSGGMQWKQVLDGTITFFPDAANRNTRYGAYESRDDGVMATVDGPVLHIFTREWMVYINDKMKAGNADSAANQKKNLEGF